MTKPTKQSRSTLACIIGNIIEWYEFTLFAYLAPVFAHLFFPKEDKLAGLLSTLLIFSLGFLIRPLGAVLLGHLGDRKGRAVTLKLTILLISISSIVTGLLPSYATIGIGAPILLIICRLAQGLCIGGEFAGAMIFLTEVAPANKRAWLSCMTNNGSNIGVLLAVGACSLVSSLLPNALFIAYGWRLLFMLGGLLGLLGLWLRRDIHESALFSEIQARTQSYIPLKYVFSTQRLRLLKISLLLFMSACGSYVLMGYLSTYFHVYLHISLTRAYRLQTFFIILSLVMVPFFAYLCDRHGRKKLLMLAALGYLLTSWPVFYLFNITHSIWLLLPLIIFYSIEQASTPATIVELFPAKGRYTGVSFAYNMAMALVGGTAAFSNTWLIAHFNNPMIIAYYVMLCAIISLSVIGVGLPQAFGCTRDLTDSTGAS